MILHREPYQPEKYFTVALLDWKNTLHMSVKIYVTYSIFRYGTQEMFWTSVLAIQACHEQV